MTFPTPTHLFLFDQTGKDAMGVHDLSTVVGSPTYAAGLIDDAVTLNGSNQYFQAADNTVFDITTQDFSIWGYFKLTTAGAQVEIVNKYAAAGGYLVRINASNQLTVFIRQTTAGADTGISLTSQTVSAGKWYFFAASFTRASNVNLYLVDMSTQTTYTTSGAISSQAGSLTNTNILTVGYNPTSGNSWFPGQLDHLNLLSGTAITSSDVTDLATRSRIAIDKRNKTDNSIITYFEARQFNTIGIRGQVPVDAVADLVQTEKDATLIAVTGATMQINVDWIIITENNSVVYDNTNGSVTNASAIYAYLYNTLWPTGSNQITAEHTLTIYNGNDQSFVRTGRIAGIDIVQSADQPLTYHCTLQFQVGKV